MMNKYIKNIACTIAMLGIGLSTPAIAKADSMENLLTHDPKTGIVLTEIIAKDEKPIFRAEICVRNMYGNSDIYGALEYQDDDTSFAKIRIQAVPIDHGILGLGATFQHIDAGNNESHQEAGLLLRIKGKPTENTFGKADLRYFGKTDTIDTYAFIDSEYVFFDLLASYNTETDATLVRPAIDAKLHKNLSVGIEAKFAGTIDRLKQAYVGIRAKLSF